LKFARDRRCWLEWLFEGKKRYGVRILNYTVTSNHIHLLVKDGHGREVIPKTMQLIAGRTGQEYNQRKNRKGAYWEDRYHATAVEAGFYLIQCLVYMDLNMVRAGAVAHPSAWPFSGYNEIQNPRERYSLIDYGSLMDLLNIKSAGELKEAYRGWVEESLEKQACERQPRWTESIAVGSEAFVKEIKEKLGIRAPGRKVIGENGNCELREVGVFYKPNFGLENSGLSFENTYYWDTAI